MHVPWQYCTCYMLSLMGYVCFHTHIVFLENQFTRFLFRSKLANTESSAVFWNLNEEM